MCQRLADIGGHCSIESAPGQGTNVRFVLALNFSAKDVNKIMITVSIVDDEKELRQSITTFVNGSPGFKCVSAYGSAEAALKGLPADKPDVVLMDINLGGMNGIECVERLKVEAPADADFDAHRL